MKLTLVGAGSTYSPELIDGLIENWRFFPIREVVLTDIDEKRLKTVAQFCERMARSRGAQFNVMTTMSLRQALIGADFVITQIRVAGQEGRHWDINLGRRHGIIGQETTGVGGFSKAMRTIPQIMEICRAIEEVAPEAWLINFTNPSGIVTEAIARFSRVKVIGLCNIPLNMKMDLAELLAVDAEGLSLDYVGLNHLAWVRHVYYRGEDLLDQALSQGLNQPSNISKTQISEKFLRALKMIPSPYLKYFYNTPAIIKEQRDVSETRAEQVMKVEEKLLKLYADPNVERKPPELAQRGGAYYSHAAVEIMSSIYADNKRVIIVNVQNNGAIPSFAKEDVLEIPAVISRRPPMPLFIGELEPEIKGLMSQVKAYETLTVEAAIEKSYTKALLALSNNPLVHGVEQAAVLLDAIAERYDLEIN